jgi:hypothetical protein
MATMEPVPEIVTRRFGRESARPHITDEYHPESGWTSVKSRQVLDFDAVEQLHASGVTLVRAKWHFHTHEFSVYRLREELDLLQPH